MDDLLSNNTDEEMQPDNVDKTVGNTFAQKYVEDIKLHFDEQIAGMNFYVEKSLMNLKRTSWENTPKLLQRRMCFLELYKNDNIQLRKQVKDLPEILNGTVKVLQNVHQNKQSQSSMTPPISLLIAIKILQRKISVRSPMT